MLNIESKLVIHKDDRYGIDGMLGGTNKSLTYRQKCTERPSQNEWSWQLWVDSYVILKSVPFGDRQDGPALSLHVLYLEMQIKPIVTQQANWLEIAGDRCICQDRASVCHWSQASSICGPLAQTSTLVLITPLWAWARLMQEGDTGCMNVS